MAARTDNITHLAPKRIPGTINGFIFRWRDWYDNGFGFGEFGNLPFGSYGNVLYQLYINGKLATETRNIYDAKELIASVGGMFSWQIVAIDPSEAGSDNSSLLDYTDTIGARVSIKWPRQSSELELDSSVNIYWDAGTGTIITSEPINPESVKNFPKGTGKWGAGLGAFGEVFGYDGNGTGFGLGDFANGEFGYDYDFVEFQTVPLSPGTYKFKLKMIDKYGNEDDGSFSEITQQVDCSPPPPEIEIKSYVSGTNTLTLTVTEGTLTNEYPTS